MNAAARHATHKRAKRQQTGCFFDNDFYERNENALIIMSQHEWTLIGHLMNTNDDVKTTTNWTNETKTHVLFFLTQMNTNVILL